MCHGLVCMEDFQALPAGPPIEFSVSRSGPSGVLQVSACRVFRRLDLVRLEGFEVL